MMMDVALFTAVTLVLVFGVVVLQFQRMQTRLNRLEEKLDGLCHDLDEVLKRLS
jgi:hypothetical protein